MILTMEKLLKIFFFRFVTNSVFNKKHSRFQRTWLFVTYSVSRYLHRHLLRPRLWLSNSCHFQPPIYNHYLNQTVLNTKFGCLLDLNLTKQRNTVHLIFISSRNMFHMNGSFVGKIKSIMSLSFCHFLLHFYLYLCQHFPCFYNSPLLCLVIFNVGEIKPWGQSTNHLKAASTPEDPKNTKRHWQLDCIFFTFGICLSKSWA